MICGWGSVRRLGLLLSSLGSGVGVRDGPDGLLGQQGRVAEDGRAGAQLAEGAQHHWKTNTQSPLNLIDIVMSPTSSGLRVFCSGACTAACSRAEAEAEATTVQQKASDVSGRDQSQ